MAAVGLQDWFGDSTGCPSLTVSPRQHRLLNGTIGTPADALAYIKMPSAMKDFSIGLRDGHQYVHEH